LASVSEVDSISAVPHFMQKRRAGLFGVEQFGQIRGGITSPSGIFCPHFMQNLRAAAFGVPQFVQVRMGSGSGPGVEAVGIDSAGCARSAGTVISSKSPGSTINVGSPGVAPAPRPAARRAAL
jgi:hypothetical protein